MAPKERLASTLHTTHNIHFLADLRRRARKAAEEGRFASMRAEWEASEAADDY